MFFSVFLLDAASNPQVRRAEEDLAAFLIRRFASSVLIKRISPGPDRTKVGLDEIMLTHTVKQLWESPDQTPNLRSRPATFSQTDWPAPAPFGDELPAVDDFQLELLPSRAFDLWFMKCPRETPTS